jgi:hypothetical protein
VLVHKGHPIDESHEQIRYVERAFEGPSLSPFPEKAKEVDVWVDFTSLKCTHGLGEMTDMATRLGCCLPGISIPLFVAMIQEIPYSQILISVGRASSSP